MRPLCIAIALSLALAGCASLASNRSILRQVQRRSLTLTDTVTQTITITLPEVRTDTLVRTLGLTKTDTVTLTKDRLTVRYVRVSADTLYLDGECAADTIVREVKVPVERIVTAPQPQGYTWAIVALSITVAVLIFARGKR